jgi:hypothetical protein
MNIFDKFGFTPVIGAVGGLATISVGQVNEYLGLAIGVSTLVFTIMKCVDLWKTMRKK